MREDIFDKTRRNINRLKARWGELLPRGKIIIVVICLVILHIAMWWISTPSVNPKIGDQCFADDWSFGLKSYAIVDVQGDFVLALDSRYANLTPDWINVSDLDVCIQVPRAK